MKIKNIFKTILSGLGILILFFVLLIGVIFLIFRPDEMCGNKLIETSYSPNKELKILIFSVDCGATTGFSTQMSLVDSDYELDKNDNGNIFVADSNHGKANTNGELIQLKIKWIDNENVEVYYAKNARVFKDKSSKKGVEILYKEF